MDTEKQTEEAVHHEHSPTAVEVDVERLEAVEGEGLSPLQESLKRFSRDKRAMASLILISVLFIGSFVMLPIYEHIGDVISLKGGFIKAGPELYHDPTFLDTDHVHASFSALHWLGTDDQGHDQFARILAGIQVSVLVSVLVVGSLDVIFGVIFGVIAGYFGGWIDFLLARFTDLMFAFPGLLFAILVASIFGQTFDHTFGGSGRLILVSLALGITVWPQMARYVRGQTLQLKQQQFVEAARTVGSSPFQIIMRHILPNITSLIIVAVTLDMASLIVGESTLSLLGLGVQPPNASLGLMISLSNPYLPYYPFEELLPIIVLVVIVVGLSFIGDGMRDAFDPRTKD